MRKEIDEREREREREREMKKKNEVGVGTRVIFSRNNKKLLLIFHHIFTQN